MVCVFYNLKIKKKERMTYYPEGTGKKDQLSSFGKQVKGQKNYIQILCFMQRKYFPQERESSSGTTHIVPLSRDVQNESQVLRTGEELQVRGREAGMNSPRLSQSQRDSS